MTKKSQFDRTIYLFQGGGALGSYQAGVFQALHEHGYQPDWIIGTSIGAINSAIIAGNAPENRVEKLQGFWQTIATKLPPPPEGINNILMERGYHYLSSKLTEWLGQPGFFRPRLISPWLNAESTVDKLSYYDTEELRDTLTRFIDFDLLNEKKVRLCVGAVRIATGQLVYFDNTKIEIKPEHIMASGAIPPGFPAICIDEAMYWDGGVHSNTQINLLFDEISSIKTLCIMVHLFDSFGKRPANMDDVLKRQKDIKYASHHREFIHAFRTMHYLKTAIHQLSRHLPKEKKEDPKLKKLIELGTDNLIHLARFHYKGKKSDLSSKDYEFSLATIQEHLRCGYVDACRTLKDPPWEKPHNEKEGLIVYELSEEETPEGVMFTE